MVFNKQGFSLDLKTNENEIFIEEIDKKIANVFTR